MLQEFFHVLDYTFAGDYKKKYLSKFFRRWVLDMSKMIKNGFGPCKQKPPDRVYSGVKRMDYIMERLKFVYLRKMAFSIVPIVTDGIVFCGENAESGKVEE